MCIMVVCAEDAAFRLGCMHVFKCTATLVPHPRCNRAGELLSPFPDKRAAAAWYGVDATCTPPQNRTLLNQQVGP